MSNKFSVVLIAAVGLLLMCGTAWADSVPITNASFASAFPFTTNCGTSCGFNSSGIPGWNGTIAGSFEPGGFFPSIPLGTVVGYTNGGTISQLLTGNSVLADTQYTLSVLVGNRIDQVNGDFLIQLEADLGGVFTPLCSLMGDASKITAGTFQTESCTYSGTNGGSIPAGDLFINFVASANQHGSQLDVYNASLTFQPESVNVPEPSSALLLAVGMLLALSALFWSQKKQFRLDA